MPRKIPVCRDGNALAVLSKTRGCNLPRAVEIPTWRLLFLTRGDLRHTETDASNEWGRTRSEWDAGNESLGQSQGTEERGKGEF